MAARLNGWLSSILRSHKVLANSLNYSTILEGFSGRYSVEDAPLVEYINKSPTSIYMNKGYK